VAPGTEALVSTPCHIKPYMRFSLIRLSDNVRPTTCKAVDRFVPVDRSMPDRSAAPTPQTPPALASISTVLELANSAGAQAKRRTSVLSPNQGIGVGTSVSPEATR